MKLRLWQIDAFASRPLEGNPAAVMPLDRWLDDNLMQRIAAENNLSETAFFVRRDDGAYDLRWFTPTSEIELCGHATLASAFVIFNFLDGAQDRVTFHTLSGPLTVTRGPDGRNIMSLPADPVLPFAGPADTASEIGRALGCPPPAALFQGIRFLAVWNETYVIPRLPGPGNIATVLGALGLRTLIVSAPGTGDVDFVSRFFAMGYGVPEDPVTGSAHCALTPYWAARLGKSELKARQVSPRGGDLYCTDAGDRTIIAGDCAPYLTGEITL